MTLIQEVWADTLDDEMEIIRQVVLDYPYISMDTEFPGVVARPLGVFKNQSDYLYQTLRCNVDLLRIIQLGLTFSSKDGKFPDQDDNSSLPRTWQFNFNFSLEQDCYAQESIDLLLKSGIDFEAHKKRGIDVMEFGAALTDSGLVLASNVYWISFHSGYDFGYLLKVLYNQPLPPTESEFFELLNLFFPNFYDIKFIVTKYGSAIWKGAVGLQDLVDELGIQRIGIQHQAGSDSLVTCLAFYRIREILKEVSDKEMIGCLYGLGAGATNNIYTLNPISNPTTSTASIAINTGTSNATTAMTFASLSSSLPTSINIPTPISSTSSKIMKNVDEIEFSELSNQGK